MQGMLEAVMNRANSKGVIRTLLGRKCRFDLWEPTQWGVHKPLPLNQAKVEYGEAIKRYGTYKALNRLIQGSAADQTKKAMVDVEDLDTLAGSSGRLKWMRLTKNHREVLGEIKFDGKIDQIKSDYRKSKRTG